MHAITSFIQPDRPDDITTRLDLVHRILAVTNGTVTDILEAAFEEPVAISAVAVDRRECDLASDTDGSARYARRQVVLSGMRSRIVYAFAESLIATDSLPEAVKEELAPCRVSLGLLWQRHRLELWKEPAAVELTTAGALASWLNVGREDAVMSRRYKVFRSGQPVFIINEVFPLRWTPVVTVD